MRKQIEIHCINNGAKKEYKLGKSLSHIINDQKIELAYPILGARVNNKLEELTYQIFQPKTVKFIDITDTDGMRMYIRSLMFVHLRAVKDILPDASLKIEHSISKGLYCEIEDMKNIPVQTVLEIGERMRQIVDENIPFIRKEIPTEDAIKIFEENHFHDKVKLFKTRTTLYTSVYYLGNHADYFYGFLVPSTGYLQIFDLVKYYNGMLLMYPCQEKPNEVQDNIKQDKMFEIVREYQQWGEILGASTIGDINEHILKGDAGELIKVSEALHEKKVSQIADEIKKKTKVKIVLISGPSSSGKTTFCMRLAVQLKVAGLKSFQISLDNYFVDRDKTPIDKNGNYNFEVLEALDVELFNQNLLDLLAGQEVTLPKFSFETGKRFYNGTKLKLSEDTIILVEGIHALNPDLSMRIPHENKFKVYVSALTQVGIDSHNRIPTTDNRLIRRLIRDFQYRNYSAIDTLRRWPSVRDGEDHYIFPFQEEADIMFNSALLFELGVLKKYIEPLLKEVFENAPEYSEAHRLLKFLSYFKPISDEDEAEIPPTSIIREFLKGSSFNY
jgi:uridine kinase